MAQVQALIAGTAKHFPNAQFTLGKIVYTTASLTQLLQGLGTAITAVVTAQASVKDALRALAGVEAQVAPVIRLYKRYVLAMFGDATQDLADFGMTPPKQPKPKTGEETAAAAAKAKATRAARGTKGAKAKSAIKGDVTGVTITPVTSAAPAAVPPATSASTQQTTSNASSAPSPNGAPSATK
ncbi:MAG TPA: hypothetical protein VMI75_24690 [Polyangiaceae bacterium]|nr:hypothetical protein [Polyangiaceae bacterium]